MSPDPQAEAFVRAILRQPDDTTARLVFADWLDERGGPSNEAWARFLRARVGANGLCAGTVECDQLVREAADAARHIGVRLTVYATRFADDPAPLFQFLPPENFTVRLGDIEIRRSVVEWLPESVARENVVLPLHVRGRSLLVAAAEPRDRETVEKLEFILNAEVTAVRAELDDAVAAINRHYGQVETESVDCVLYESPLVGLNGDWVSGRLFSLFHTAFSRGMTGFELTDEGQDCRLTYYNHVGVADIGFIPTPAFRRLRDCLRALPVRSESVENGVRVVRVEIPLLSGRPFPAAVTFRRRRLRTTTLRVDFLW